MGHYIQAIISKENMLRPLAAKYHEARVVRLAADFAMIPLTPALYDEMVSRLSAEGSGSDGVSAKTVESSSTARSLSLSDADVFMHLVPIIADQLAVLSTSGAVAYVETEYAGGVGFQKAMAWKNGKAQYGPEVSGKPGAINRALAVIGVCRTRRQDEFVTVGLQFFRCADEFKDPQSHYYDECYVEQQVAEYLQLETMRRPWWKRLLGI